MSAFARLALSVIAGGLLAGSVALASVGLYVGSELTEDGSVILGGYGDEPSSHWIEIIPAMDHDYLTH